MTRPLLQLAIDVLSLDEALRVVDVTWPHFDIVEVGTPLIIEEGLRAVVALKERCPDKLVLADLKIMDAGRIEAGSGFARGADIVTILAVADDATVAAAVSSAKEHGKRLMADLINAPDPVGRAKELEVLGVDMLCVHTAYDTQGAGDGPTGTLEAVRPTVACDLAIAGGLKLATVGPAVSAGANVIVVGGGILSQDDPRAAAQAIMQALAGAHA